MTEPSIQTLGRYIIHAELGKGGFATVYRATDTILERDIALKILKPGWTDDAKAVERFMREAKQASRLRHTNIVTIFDVGQAEGRLFIAMELVRGRSLQQIIAEDGALPWARVLAILEQSAAALDYAHAEGLVHRDIKPANIILDESKPGSAVHVMLTDFGLVRGAEQASLSMGSTGGLLGTPEYIAPEIWDGETATKASDIYALGCVAFYLLTGKVLFSATTPMAVLKRHAEGPVFPQQWPSGVPAGVEAVLRRALAKDPSHRQASAAELAAELRACGGQAAREQAAREQAAREQEARQKEEAQRAAQAALALQAARKARDEQERQQQAELAAQTAAAEKVKRDAAERERQRQAREAARLAEEEARRKELVAAQQKAREEQQQPVEKPVSHPQAETPRRQTSISAPKAKSNRTWLYVVGGVIALLAIVIVLASINPAPTPAPTMAPAQPTATLAQPTAAPAQPTAAPAVSPTAVQVPHTPSPSFGTLLITSFEDLSVSSPDRIAPFLFTRELPGTDVYSFPVHPEFTSWKVDSRSRTGNLAINAIPNGNPSTDLATTATTAISSALLDIVFDVSRYDTVSLNFWVNSTSNPRVASIHNCDSSLNVYFKIDSGKWTHKTAWCGQYKTESTGWQPISLSFDVAGKSTIQFAFVYELQNNPTADPTVYYLIDDLEVTAK